MRTLIKSKAFTYRQSDLHLTYFSKRMLGAGFGLKYDKKNDYYEVLGVSPRSQDSDIKKSYYKLA